MIYLQCIHALMIIVKYDKLVDTNEQWLRPLKTNNLIVQYDKDTFALIGRVTNVSKSDD